VGGRVFRVHCGHRFASSVLMDPISKAGGLFIRRAREKAPVFRTELRRNLKTGATYP
jgi:hypothetical protein